jgi:ubiquinone/menaquinone biosynthesis C-methylase UbiE
MIKDRIEREKEFHDAAFSTDIREQTWKYYSAVDHLFATYASRVVAGAGGRRVVELGCGRGSQAFDLAAEGDKVLAIDISSTAVAITRREAESRQLSLSAAVMDAHDLRLDDRSIDLVCGSGILHHLDLGRALDEVCRVLQPGGRALFLEPLGHNPVINAYRRRTPQLRSEDERPLRLHDMRAVRARFRDVSTSFAGLVTLPLALHRRTRSGASMRIASSIERRLLQHSVPGIAAWFVLLDCKNPLAV